MIGEDVHAETAFLFCCDYFDPSKPDPVYAHEYEQAITHGFKTYLFDFDAFRNRGSCRMPTAEQQSTMVYRGWMMTVEQYEGLYARLADGGFKLINTPNQYANTHLLPNWYPLVEADTAMSVWSDSVPSDVQLVAMLDRFEPHTSLIVKDWVKSRKHEWLEACFIPDSTDTAQALGVIRTFIDRQDTELVGGVVLREYLPLKLTGLHETSVMPLAEEVRVFCYQHQPLAQLAYWSGQKRVDNSDYQHLLEACQVIDNDFFSVDLALQADGRWVIIEIGDGQVSGLQGLDPVLVYDALRKLVNATASRFSVTRR